MERVINAIAVDIVIDPHFCAYSATKWWMSNSALVSDQPHTKKT